MSDNTVTDQKIITFLSSRGRGIGAEMSVLRRYMTENRGEEDLFFRSFSKNERAANDRAGLGNSKLRRRFLENAENIVCVDNSLSGSNYLPESVRLLIASPYEYQFRMALALEKKEKNSGMFKRFTHIIPGSPFTEELLQRGYQLPQAEILSGYVFPFAWEVCHEPMEQRVRNEIGYYYPQIHEKKVITVIISGADEKNAEYWENFELKQWLDAVRKEYFVLTNSQMLVEAAGALEEEYRDCFGYVSRIWKQRDLLAVTDVLVTNNGWMASAYAGRRKPVYCPLCANLQFEKYMQKHYAAMCIPDADKLAAMGAEDFAMNDVQKHFSKNFYYEDAKNPCERIFELFRKNVRS